MRRKNVAFLVAAEAQREAAAAAVVVKGLRLASMCSILFHHVFCF